jgi:arylsulfatase A
MKRYTAIGLLFAWAGLLSAAPLKPNIVLIFVDDMGYGDAACYGNRKIKTPNIDRLAAEGQRWTSFYASGSTCVPSRTGLMSGRHPALLGREKLAGTQRQLLPALLKRAGYATTMFGKWHLAGGLQEQFLKSPMHPLECGFDHHFGTPASNDIPAPPGKVQNRELFDTCDKFTFPIPLIRGREIVEYPADQELFTRRYTEGAVRWIHEKSNEHFLLYLAHNMPHTPIFASKAFQGRSAGGRYGDVIEEIDWSVGEVMKALKETGIDEKTLVIFTSDNGPWTMFGPHAGTAGPLRGEKGTSWEGGFRVPGIFRWPGRIKPGVVDELAANLDLHATFANLVGEAAPRELPGYISQDLTGVLLRGEPSPRKQWLYTGGGALAFRSGDYKLHLVSKDRLGNPDTRKREPVTRHDPPLLFDLRHDLGESGDVASANPGVVERLRREMTAFQAR